jgi:hypothetical protein
LGSCSHERRYVGCPFFAPPRALARSRVGEGRQAPTGAVLRVLAPLDGFGCRTRHARILANPPSPWRPDASRPCFMPLASLESPFRAFPSRGAVPDLSGLLLPCGFAFDPPNGAARTEGFAAPFPVAPTSRRGSPVRAGRTGRPGRRFPGVARTLSVARCRARFQRPRLGTAGLAGYGGRHARFEALLPSRVRSIQRSPPWQGDERPVGALLGFSSLEPPASCLAGSARLRADGHPASFPARRARG